MNKSKVQALDVHVSHSRSALAQAVAEGLAHEVAMALELKPEVSIVLDLGMGQEELAGAIKARRDIEWGRVTVLNSGDFMWIAEKAPGSQASWLRRNLLDGLRPKGFVTMRSDHEPIEEELDRFTRLYNALEPAISVIEVGSNGELGFHAPPADFGTKDVLRIVTLDERKRAEAFEAGSFPSRDRVPLSALCITVHALLAAGKVIAFAPVGGPPGMSKRILDGQVTPAYPASVLHTHRDAALYLIDEGV